MPHANETLNQSEDAAAFDYDLSRRLVWYRRMGTLLNSARVQLVGALTSGMIGAHLVRLYYEQIPDDLISYDATIIGTAIAILMGYMIYRKVTSLPGTAALMNIIPAFTISYLTIAAFYFALRLDFSRQQFLLSYLMVVLFFFAVGFVAVRLRKPVYGYVPGGRTMALTGLDYADWIRIRTPQDARIDPQLPIVADFHAEEVTPEWERFLADEAIAGRRIFNAKQLLESLEGKVEIEHLSENSFGHLAPDSIYAPAKFYLDFIFALAAVILLSPLFLLVGLAIRLESKGPAIFRQERMGYRGRVFTIYKFRSMREAPEDASLENDMTQTDDARITLIGRLIRKTRIDELPQIFNILLGQMSWIGPRPETVRLADWYEKELPFYRYRHIVRPGITGWAQVKQGHVTSVWDVRDKLQFDFFYVKNFSIWLDILIVVQTVRVMLTGHGAK